MILFSQVEPDDCLGAYHWHRGFAASNDALFPRPQEDYQTLVFDGGVWSAKSPSGDFLGLAYASYDEANALCEIGGLMVSTQCRGKGIGSTLMQACLAHALLEEDLLGVQNGKVVTHVLRSNQMPRRIIEDVLKFRLDRTVQIHGSRLPGLRTDDDGYVRGDEFVLTQPESITALADWSNSWNGKLKDGDSAHVELRSGLSMLDWSAALRAIEERGGREGPPAVSRPFT